MASISQQVKRVKLRAEKEVLSVYIANQEPFLEDHVTDISKACWQEKLISEKTHNRILHPDNKSKQKVTLLLMAIERSMDKNEDCFELFIFILEKTGLFKELVRQLKLSVEEAIERMHKAQATRRKRASQQELARQSAILENLGELEAVCTGLLTRIISESLTKKIITRKNYLERSKTLSDKNSKTKCFLKCVCLAVRRESKKYETFLEILDKHTSCRPIVQKIRHSVEHFKASKTELVATPALGLPPLDQIVMPEMPAIAKPFNANVDHAATVNGDNGRLPEPGVTIANRHSVQASTSESDSTSGMCRIRNSRQQEMEYQRRMEEGQNEAKEIDKLKTKNEKLSYEKCHMLTQITQLEQKLALKQTELTKMEREKEKLVNEVETLKFAVRKAEYSTEVVQTLKDRIAAKETEIELKNKKIHELGKEQDTLQNELSEKNQLLIETRQILQETLHTLRDLRTFNRQQSRENQTMHRQNRNIILSIFGVVLVGFLIILYVILYSK